MKRYDVFRSKARPRKLPGSSTEILRLDIEYDIAKATACLVFVVVASPRNTAKRFSQIHSNSLIVKPQSALALR